MSDSEVEPAPTEAELEKYWTSRFLAQPDRLLATYVETVEKNDTLEVPLTLLVSGALVSGMLLGRRRWAASQAEEMDEETAAMLLGPFQKAWEEVAERIAAESRDNATPTYFDQAHLRHARWYSGPERPIPGGTNGLHIRVRLNAVDGWFLGQLGSGE